MSTGGATPQEPLVFTPEAGRVRTSDEVGDRRPDRRPDRHVEDGAGGGRGPAGRRRRRLFGGWRRRDDIMVPEAQFSSYYGRQIVKPAPWKHEIPTYLYLGGLAGGSALLAAGAELTGRAELRRNSRLVALVALVGSTTALIVDLGKPSRFLNMMRTVKLTSPMSIGTWILTGYGGFTGAAVACEAARLVLPERTWARRVVGVVERPVSLGSAAFGPPLAAYTAVLLADTATPTWHGAYRELPFVFVGSALAASGGAALVTTTPDQTSPARRLAVFGVTMELVAHHLMERRLGLLAEPLHEGRPRTWTRLSQGLTVGGALLAAFAGRRRALAVLAGLALNAGSGLIRFAVFEAGIASAKDPKYTVVPQRERLERRRRAARQDGGDRHGIATV